MAMSDPQSSVFTFESTVHSSHVLRWLDEQRHRDILCDVTVVVEGQSFRAHRAVLTASSEYFTQRISTQHGAVVTLPQEVTVAGFEPLLKFAYTSRLLFGKDNVVEIRNSASILGFRDLDEACFDFLLPRFFSSTKSSAPLPRKTCCKKKCKGHSTKRELGIICDDTMLDEKEVKPVADSPSQREVAWLCNKSAKSKMGSQNVADTLTPEVEGTNNHFMQCPKYRRQLACGKETCVMEKSLNDPVTLISDECELSCPLRSCSSYTGNVTKLEFPGDIFSNSNRQSRDGNDIQGKTEIEDKETKCERQWRKRENNMNTEEDINCSNGSTVKAVSPGPSTELGQESSRLILHHSTLKTFGDSPAITVSVGHERSDTDMDTTDKKITDSVAQRQAAVHQKVVDHVDTEPKRTDEKRDPGWQERREERKTDRIENGVRERSSVEREVAEHQAKWLGSDIDTPQQSIQNPDARRSSPEAGREPEQSTTLEWLNFHVNLSSSTSSTCPFFRDLDQAQCLWKGKDLSEGEEASQSGVSSLNSGEDGDSDTETEGDSESYTLEEARQVQLPFSVDWVVDLSRNDFQQLLKQQVFTREQLAFIHDMRRRSKNRLAAQRCRKRKLDCIYNLQCEINKLKAEREKLMAEKNQLGQLKVKTYHSVSALCQRVCNEANLQPEQLQVFAKYTSPDNPLSSICPHLDELLSQHGLPPQVQASVPACFGGLEEYIASKVSPSSSSRDTVTGDGSIS